MSHAIEHLERAALEDLHAAAPQPLRESLAIAPRWVGGAFVSAAGRAATSAIVINRALGLGLDAPADEATVDALLQHYADTGVRRYFVHVHPQAQPAGLADGLIARGLERARGWAKFSRGREAPPEARSDLSVRPATSEDTEAVGRIIAKGFDLGLQCIPWLGALIGRPGWHVYVTHDGDTVAGAATLFVRDDMAWLDWAATDPDWRGRGSQSALLTRRIADALDMGCQVLGTTTGEAVPGDPQHSYHNIERAGFRRDYAVENYAPPKPA